MSNIFSLDEQNYKSCKQNNQLAERMDGRSPVRTRGSRGEVAGSRARAEDYDHPVSFIGDPDTGVFGVVQVLVVLGLGVVGQHHIGHEARHAGRQHLSISDHRCVEMAVVEVLRVVRELRLSAGDGVGSGGVGALLAFELLRQLFGQTVGIAVLGERRDLESRSVAVDALEKLGVTS